MRKLYYLSIAIMALMLCGASNKALAMQGTAATAGLSDWQQKTNKGGATTFSIDAQNVLNVSSTEYANAYFEKTFVVNPHTTYIFSADVMSDAVAATGEKDCASLVCQSPSINNGIVYNSEVAGWQPLSLTFETGSSTQITLSLRQGWDKEAKGSTQFANIRLVEQSSTVIIDNNWEILCLIPKHIDVNVLINHVERNVKISMNDFDVETATKMFTRLGASLSSMSNGQMKANIDIRVVETPLTTLSNYIDDMYWASPADINPLASPYLQQKKYDHVFTFIRLEADDAEYSVPCSEWQGLGASQYMGVSYSLIRFPADRSNWWYTDAFDTQFPETGLVHEFLHTLERISNEKGMDIPALHDAEELGYTARMNNSGEWYKWYSDYMNKNVLKPGTTRKFGLTPESYLLTKYQSTTIYELLKTDGSITGNEKTILTSSLKVWSQNGSLCVNGLTPGQPWSVYSVSGTLVYHATAATDKADIVLPTGIYIIHCGTQKAKIIIGR